MLLNFTVSSTLNTSQELKNKSVQREVLTFIKNKLNKDFIIETDCSNILGIAVQAVHEFKLSIKNN